VNGHLSLASAARVLNGKVVNDHIVCPGPGHSAKDRSLAVWFDPAAPDGFLVNPLSPQDDWATCKDFVREKLGTPPFKPSGPREETRREQHAKPRIVAEYVYRTADGEPYAKVLRYEPKDFRQQHWTGSAWAWGAPKGPKLPYRLPELLEAVGDEVFVVEGEKDADNLASLGFVATTNVAGAGKWTADLAEWFKGRTVHILPDNDEAGRAHARHVADSLHGVAVEVRVVELPGRPEKGDVSD
jgi:hypothetical protein